MIALYNCSYSLLVLFFAFVAVVTFNVNCNLTETVFARSFHDKNVKHGIKSIFKRCDIIYLTRYHWQKDGGTMENNAKRGKSNEAKGYDILLLLFVLDLCSPLSLLHSHVFSSFEFFLAHSFSFRFFFHLA